MKLLNRSANISRRIKANHLALCTDEVVNPSTKAYVGWVFQLTNLKHKIELRGSPFEILQKLSAARIPPTIFSAAESQVKAAQCNVDAVPAKFHGGPHIAGIMQILDALAAKRYDEAADVIRKDSMVLIGDHDAAAVPLTQFAVLGVADAVSFLIDHGTPIDRPHHLGMTALHWAAATGKTNVVEVLLARGANPSLNSWFLLTPGQLADANRHRQLADRLATSDPEPLDGWKMMQVLKRMGGA